MLIAMALCTFDILKATGERRQQGGAGWRGERDLEQSAEKLAHLEIVLFCRAWRVWLVKRAAAQEECGHQVDGTRDGWVADVGG